MGDRTALGDRMKGYEAVTRAVLPRRTYCLIRVDGRSFHSFLRHAGRPYDHTVMEAMDEVGRALCSEVSGGVFSFTQSDECSVLLADLGSGQTEPWFGGVVQKMASVAASTATVAFNRAYGAHRSDSYATFDARVFTIPDPVEVANYFLWRQRDCVRNSITMAAQARFSHHELHGRSTGDMQEMLWSEHGVNWNDYPAGAKRGRVCTRKTEEREVTFTDRRDGTENTIVATRSSWRTEPAPHFTLAPDGWLASVIPPLPSLREDPELVPR
ncbi:tRNA(His) guanylyltransferase Thg1 family protein [Sphaerisporangium fuscum]|uniref:tRNA(His) guanylyltransferase Thg1 family protein n=1 Tax=Sphaerisporangium fuscum TaxID=2835868 RepID=UPI001BDDAAE7|nr:tRNA(His) guanylyltransferase Thg1 family protein [Sphaerisporangium fuscum]